MRKHLAIITALLAALLLFGCAAVPGEPQPPRPTAAPTEAVTEAATEPVTEPVTEVPTELPTAAPTEAATDAPTEPAEIPYLQKVSYADQPILGGPSYDYGLVGTVRVSGTYTIVEEAWDTEGNLWGRLKSGAGWINLTEVRLRLEFPDPLSVGYAKYAAPDGDFHHYVGCTGEYAVGLVFRAHEELTDLRLYSMVLNETLELGEERFVLSRLAPDKPLVADLDFPGDMSTYALLFTDSAGNERCFTVYISLRNGMPILTEEAG